MWIVLLTISQEEKKYTYLSIGIQWIIFLAGIVFLDKINGFKIVGAFLIAIGCSIVQIEILGNRESFNKTNIQL